MLTVGEKLWNGVIVTAGMAEAYNRECARIEQYEREGRAAPENLLNGRHHLMAHVFDVKSK